LLGRSRQSYYKHCHSLATKKDVSATVISYVENLRIEMPRIGGRKLYYLLDEKLKSLNVGRDKFFRILKANNKLIVPRRSYHVTTNSHHRFHKYKDIMNRLDINHPEQVWVSDITYIGSRKNNCYLALVTDAYSKKIEGYDLSSSLSVDGSVRALKKAIKNRIYNTKLIHHSDRGIQYCSNEYQKILKRRGIKVSMTESYDPYSNAIAERVNGILKQEFLLEEYNCDIKDLKKIVEQSIEIYNNKRPHISCGMLTPNKMHMQNKIRKPSYSKKNQYKRKLTSVCTD